MNGISALIGIKSELLTEEDNGYRYWPLLSTSKVPSSLINITNYSDSFPNAYLLNKCLLSM